MRAPRCAAIVVFIFQAITSDKCGATFVSWSLFIFRLSLSAFFWKKKRKPQQNGNTATAAAKTALFAGGMMSNRLHRSFKKNFSGAPVVQSPCSSATGRSSPWISRLFCCWSPLFFWPVRPPTFRSKVGNISSLYFFKKVGPFFEIVEA